MRPNVTVLLLSIALGASSCSDCEAPDPHDHLSAMNYLPMTAGSWWAYVNARNSSGEAPVVLSRDTLWAVGDTVINGETYARFYGRLAGYSSVSHFAIRDSSFHLIRENGHLILPYHNFTDTFNYSADQQLNTYVFSRMFHDTVPTVVPAGMFQAVDFRMEIGRGSYVQQFCAQHPVGYSHSKWSEGVGMLLSTYWYSATGPCVFFSRELEDYHIE